MPIGMNTYIYASVHSTHIKGEKAEMRKRRGKEETSSLRVRIILLGNHI